MVGLANRILVMFDDQHRVADVPQPPQRAQQPLIIALVQADGRLVQHIQNPGQPRADLGCQPDALRLAARQRGRGAAQRQVVQPDIDQELQPLLDFLEDAARDIRSLRRQRRGHGGEPGTRIADRELAHCADMAIGHPHAQRLGFQAEPGAHMACFSCLIPRQILAHPGVVGLAEAAFQVGNHALERLLHLIGAQAILVSQRDRFFAGSLQDGLAEFLRQFAPGPVHALPEMLRQAVQGLVVIR